jgi:multiple sugar transport system permease protein
MTTTSIVRPRSVALERRTGEAPRIATGIGSLRIRVRLAPIVTLALFLFFFLLPIAFLVALSFKTRDEVLLGQFFTSKPTLDNWRMAFQVIHLTAFIWHSLLVASLAAVLTLLITAPATYAVVRLGHGHFIGSLTLSSYIAPPVVALLPLFFLLRWLGLLNSFAGMILAYGIMNIPVAYWLLRGFVVRIPAAFDEAAWVDGASYFKTFVLVDLPLMVPGMVAAGIICLILAYNEFLFASLFAPGDSVRGLTVAISLFQGDRFVNFGQMAVASLAGIAPIYAIAFAFQNRLLGGLTAGGMR